MRGSRILFQGGGGPGLIARKLSGPFFCFLVLNLFYSLQRASNGFITEKTILSNDPEGISRGVQLFHGGPNANFYRNPYNL